MPGAWGGQRTWLAPELGPKGYFGSGVEDWKVPPELDPGRYQRIESSSAELSFHCDLSLKRRDGCPISLGIVRSIRLESISAGSRRGCRIRVRNGLINGMDQDLEEIGLWSILQSPAEVPGTFLIPLKNAETQPSPQKPYRLYFGDLPPDRVAETPFLLYLRACAGKWFKISIPPCRRRRSHRLASAFKSRGTAYADDPALFSRAVGPLHR